MDRVQTITQALEYAVEQEVFPGAVLFARYQGEIIYHKGVGKMGVAPHDHPVHTGTIYDLASLTKPLATATAILCLIHDGQLSLDHEASKWIGEWKSGTYRSTTIRQLLQHSTGLPAWRRYYEILSPSGLFPSSETERQQRVENLFSLIAKEPMEYQPDSQSIYSDLGFIALGGIIERCTGASLAEYCRRRVYDPIQANPLFFIKGEGKFVGGSGEMKNVVPTEDDPWRGHLIHLEVHDENAYAMGGIAGHAGLFGTAAAVAVLSEAWLRGAKGQSSFLSNELVREFVVNEAVVGSRWKLGWDSPISPSSSGIGFSPQSFGHLGYAGTSLWIDPLNALEVILLSNRVNPSRKNKQIKAFRPVIHNLIFKEFMKVS